jgi:hypothetical protein
MLKISRIRSKKNEMTFLESHKTIPIKNKIFGMQKQVIIDSRKFNHISNEPMSCLKASSVLKAGIIFLGTIGLYYSVKKTGIFSYFGWGVKNSKDLNGSEITKEKFGKNDLTVRRNLETEIQTNNPNMDSISQAYIGKGSTVKFKKEKVEEFKSFQKIKKENVKNQKFSSRRSINIENSIPNQNATVGKLFELTIDGNYVFSSSSALSLEATNIPVWLMLSPLNPNSTFKGSYDTPGYAYGVAVSGNYAYVVDRYSTLQIIDISNPAYPTFKGSYNPPGESFPGVALSGNYAYMADGFFGLQIIDITDPANPTFKGSYDTPDYAYGIALSGNYAYVADSISGLQIIDITDPANPTFKGSYDTPEHANRVALSGNYAYVADGDSGLQIIDISDPANPTFKGSYDTPAHAQGVAVFGNYAYVTNWDFGLQIIDISNSSNPTFKGSYNTPGHAYEVALSANYAYVADRQSGLQIIDISDPSNPTFKDSYDTPGQAYGVAVYGN